MLDDSIDFLTNPKRRASHKGYNRLLLLLALLAFAVVQCFFIHKGHELGYRQGVEDCVEESGAEF